MFARRRLHSFICMTCALHLDIDEHLQRLEEHRWANLLDALRELPEPASLETVENLLRALTEGLEGQDRLGVALAREEAIRALQGKAGFSAQLVDAALRSDGNPGPANPSRLTFRPDH